MDHRSPDRNRLASWMSDIRLNLSGPADDVELERLDRPAEAPSDTAMLRPALAR
jgi:hypothetical protein